MRICKAWTISDRRALILHRQAGLTCTDIALKLNRTAKSCQQQIIYLKRHADYKSEIAAIGACPDSRAEPPAKAHLVPDARTPQAIDRDARLLLRFAREETDCTATFFGDPLPGYSALDRKRESVS